MPRVVRAGLIQAGIGQDAPEDIFALRQLMLEKHIALIEEAATKGVELLCLQELFTSPYFPAEQNDRWRQLAERVPDGPTVRLMQEQARKHGMVMVVPVFEEEITGLFYNTAAVIDSDGTYLGKYRKNHLPHVAPGFWEKFYFRPGNLGYPVFDTACGTVGVYICYDRHFPEGARALGLAGAEIVFNPSATVAGLSLAAGAAGPRRSQRLLPRRNQPGRSGAAVGDRRVLRQQLLVQPQGADHRPGLPRP